MTTGSINTVHAQGPEQIAGMVVSARASSTPIVDYGQAHQRLGHAPPAEHVRLVQRGSVPEHYVRDLTVRAAAGTPFAELQQALAKENQFLPLDVDGDLSLGEAIMHNVYGPMRAGYGAARDLLLGLRFISGEGEDIHVGGRTVKNVAGYDVTRLMVGSLGQLGIVYEAILRTYARPAQVAVVSAALPRAAALDRLGPRWLLGAAAPASLGLSRRDGAWRVRAGYFGRQGANEAQVRAARTLIETQPGATLQEDRAHTLEDELRETQQARAWRREAGVLVKVIVPPAATGDLCDRLAPWLDQHSQACLDALPAHGGVFVGGPADGDAATALARLIDQALRELGGLRVWHVIPEGAMGIEPFGPPQPDWPMLRQLKQTLDPLTLLNPGRFL